MASSLYRIKTGSGGTPLGRELVDRMNALGREYGEVRRLFAALDAEKDGTSGTADDFVTPAQLFGFVDAGGAVSSTTAQAAYVELNAFLQSAGPSLEQATARFRQ